MIIGKRKSGTYQRDSRDKYCLNSLDLLIEMMKQNLFEQMNFKDLYALRKQLRTKDGKDITADTPIADIEGIDFDEFGNIVCFDLEPSLKNYYEEEDTYYNRYSESEIFGCKDNDYLEEGSMSPGTLCHDECEEMGPWSYR